MDILLFKSIPANSLLLVPEEKREGYLDKALSLPEKTQDILFSGDTGAFVRGLAKSYDIDINLSPKIALAILFVAIGEKTFAQIPAVFSTELRLPADKAQKMANEIEKDIFGPVKRELEEFLSRKIAPQSRDATTPSNFPSYEGKRTRTAPQARLGSQPHNLLDLKEIAAAKKPKQLTAKPVQRSLPPNTPRAPLRPLASRGAATGETTPAPQFPLPPRIPKSPVSPIDFSKF